MDCMTTITRSQTGNRRAGFTLIELMISAALAGFILIAVLSTFLFLGRSGLSLRNYSDMESECRRGLEVFAVDVRQSQAINFPSILEVTLRVDTRDISYLYDPTNGTFVRTEAGVSRTLITGIAPGTFRFQAYSLSGAETPLTSATQRILAGSTTKQLQISLEANRTNQTLVTSSNTVLSARFILRNKPVTA